jgi:hypothetical protein
MKEFNNQDLKVDSKAKVFVFTPVATAIGEECIEYPLKALIAISASGWLFGSRSGNTRNHHELFDSSEPEPMSTVCDILRPSVGLHK